ncbi:cell division initiation protein [Streptomyces bohaiensis]|uniref:Cell division initiation protein n=1 Tax=Streptomyces bohaiensis TaxID=1431344 RepID=A0ABX1CC85_9ACTN|nr:cell division initiation protein [Streptomyces bohaiensis]NJQ15295.1 cell division initiation protein [Streptomyces bohaiensis]
MDVHQKLDEIVTTVENAKSMPMSASCVINRSDLLGRLDEVRGALPGSLAEAQQLLGGREQMVAEARQEAQSILDAARSERGTLVDNTQVVQRAQAEAARILDEAKREAAAVREEADDYVDSKLANFEVVLGKTIGSVERGRVKLLGRDGDPAELVAQADAYVEAQFGAIEAVLRKTLEAVGRGRQKLTGHRPTDELGSLGGPTDERADQAAANYGQEQPDTYYSHPGDRPSYDYAGDYQGYGEQPGASGGDYDYVTTAGAGQDGPYGGQVEPAYGGAPGHGAPNGDYADTSGYGYGQQHSSGYQQGGTLEETSLFDTAMIDSEQLRRYEQGR